MYRIMSATLLVCTLAMLSACGAAPAAAPAAPTTAPAAAPEAPAAAPATGSIGVEKPWARPATMTGAMDQGGMSQAEGTPATGSMNHGAMSDMAMGSTSAVYMTLVNTGSTADAVVSGATDVAEKVELHTVEMENNVAKMRPVPQIDIPANGSVELKPGSFHVMLLNIKKDLKPGDTVDLTLTLQSGATLTIAAPVQEMPK